MTGLAFWGGIALLVVLVGVSLELLARVWIRCGGYAVWRPGQRLHMHTDRAVLPRQQELVRFEVNSEGERGSEPPEDLSRTYRILVAGGSSAECWFLDQPSTWPEVMRSELAKPEHRARLGVDWVHVGSIGKSLVSAEMIDQVLERILPRTRKLDVLILMVGASNIANWLGKGTPAKIEEKPAVPAQVFDVRPDESFGWRPGKTAIAEILRRFRAKRFRPIEVRTGAGARLGKAREMRKNAKTVLNEAPDPSAMVDHFERRFREMLEGVVAKVPRVVIARQPWFRKDRYEPAELAAFWHGAVGNPYVEVVTTYYTAEVVAGLMELMDRRVAEVADDLGVQHVDLVSIIEPSLENYYDFWHFTPAGASVVGKAVAVALLEPVRAG